MTHANTVVESKQCPRCRERKPPPEFHKATKSKDGRQAYCKPCSIEASSEYYQKRDKTKSHYRSLARRYDLTEEQYMVMLGEQGNVCRICEEPFPNTREQHLDHCHQTGVARGIVCAKCNVRISLFDKKPELLLRYYEYIVTNYG